MGWLQTWSLLKEKSLYSVPPIHGHDLGIEMLARWLVRTEISHQILSELWTLIYVLMASVVPRVFTEHHPQCAESYTSPLSARQMSGDKWGDTSLRVRLCILGKQIAFMFILMSFTCCVNCVILLMLFSILRYNPLPSALCWDYAQRMVAATGCRLQAATIKGFLWRDQVGSDPSLFSR